MQQIKNRDGSITWAREDSDTRQDGALPPVEDTRAASANETPAPAAESKPRKARKRPKR
jgi:hypothetical protein